MTLLIDIPPALEKKLESMAAQRGVNVDVLILETLERLEPVEEPINQAGEHVGEYLIRLAEELRSGIPVEGWETVPSDLSINHDHYLYGAKKVEE